MNIKKLDEQVALLTKITESLLKEAPKKKAFEDLSNYQFDKFRLSTFQEIEKDIEKAKDAARLDDTSRAFLSLMHMIETNIINEFTSTNKFYKQLYTDFFRQFKKLRYLQRQGIKQEPVDISTGSDDALDKGLKNFYGLGVKYPTTAMVSGRRQGETYEQVQKRYSDLVEDFIEKITSVLPPEETKEFIYMSPSEEDRLNRALIEFSGDEGQAGEDYIKLAEDEAEAIVKGISTDLDSMDPASREVEGIAGEVEGMISDEEVNKFEAELDKAIAEKERDMVVPKPGESVNDPKYADAEFFDPTRTVVTTQAQSVLQQAAEIRAREIKNAKDKEALKNRDPEQIAKDSRERYIRKTIEDKVKEKRILNKITTQNLTPDQIRNILQNEYGSDMADFDKKQTFKDIAFLSLAGRAFGDKEFDEENDTKAVKNAISTIRQRLQKDFSKAKFLQYDKAELADLTEFLIKAYKICLENIFESQVDFFENVDGEKKISKLDPKESENMLDQLKLLINNLDQKAVDAYFKEQEISYGLAEEASNIDNLDLDKKIDLLTRIEEFKELRKQTIDVREMLEGFTGLRSLATIITYDYYSNKVWSASEKELEDVIKNYCSQKIDNFNSLGERVQESLVNKIKLFAMGRTYFKELEGHPAADRVQKQKDDFAFNISSRNDKRFGINLPTAKEIADDAADREKGTIGQVVKKYFEPDYLEKGIVEPFKAFLREKGPLYIFSKVYEGMLYGKFYRKIDFAVDLPTSLKDNIIKKVEEFYKIINNNEKNKNKLRDELIELIGE